MATANSPTPPTGSPSSPTEHQLALQQRREQSYINLKRNLSWGLVIACPAIMLMPPRKFDIYTVLLGGSTFFSANHLRMHYFNGPTPGALPDSSSGWFQQSMPTERAREIQAQLARQREAKEGKAQEDRGVVEKLWMGNETEGWKERRVAEDNEKIAEGMGIADMILEQVNEVFGSKKKGEVEEEGK